MIKRLFNSNSTTGSPRVQFCNQLSKIFERLSYHGTKVMLSAAVTALLIIGPAHAEIITLTKGPDNLYHVLTKGPDTIYRDATGYAYSEPEWLMMTTEQVSYINSSPFYLERDEIIPKYIGRPYAQIHPGLIVDGVGYNKLDKPMLTPIKISDLKHFPRPGGVKTVKKNNYDLNSTFHTFHLKRIEGLLIMEPWELRTGNNFYQDIDTGNIFIIYNEAKRIFVFSEDSLGSIDI